MLDGKGGVLRDVALVIEGTKIVRIDSNPSEATYDLRGSDRDARLDRHAHAHRHAFRSRDRQGPQFRKSTRRPSSRCSTPWRTPTRPSWRDSRPSRVPGAEMDKDLRDWIAEGRIPGPRVLTSLRAVTDQTGDPAQIRAFVRKAIADGADFVKIFATASIREGGAQTMTDEQIRAACDEANSARQALDRACAGSRRREGGGAGGMHVDRARQPADRRGARSDGPARHVFRLEQSPAAAQLHREQGRISGSGNFTEQGFAYMEKGLPIGNETFKRALAKKVKMTFGTDGGAGAHGRNFEELVYRVRDGGQPPMAAIVSATSMSAESLRMQDQIGSIAPGMEADIIATVGNPLDDITSVRRVVFV